MAKRRAKEIVKASDIDEILALTSEHAGERSLIMDWFGDFGDGPRFNPYDIIIIPKGYYGNKRKNKNDFKTTIGLWVFNKAFIEQFSDVLGYINETVDKDKYGEINKTLSYALLERKITTDQLKQFIMQSQVMMSCASAICPSHTMDMLLLTNKAEVKKRQIEKKYAEGLAAKDLTAMKAVEDELIEWAQDELKDSECVDMFNSGARSSWGNNFKNMYLVKGPIKQTDGSYNYVGSSYISGMKKEDYANVNDSAVGGPYSRSNKTQEGGYLEKQFTSATQHVKVLGPGSDCHTTRTITVDLNKNNINDWMYSFYINNSGRLVEITSENRDKLIGKRVKMRFSALCKAKNGCICEACAGSLYNRIGIQNIGLGTMIMMSSLKNASMKNFHDSGLKMAKINPNDIF